MISRSVADCALHVQRVSSFLFVTDATDTMQGHYRTENCTKQEAPQNI